MRSRSDNVTVVSRAFCKRLAASTAAFCATAGTTTDAEPAMTKAARSTRNVVFKVPSRTIPFHF